jgi:hypothetical protein
MLPAYELPTAWNLDHKLSHSVIDCRVAHCMYLVDNFLHEFTLRILL